MDIFYCSYLGRKPKIFITWHSKKLRSTGLNLLPADISKHVDYLKAHKNKTRKYFSSLVAKNNPKQKQEMPKNISHV